MFPWTKEPSPAPIHVPGADRNRSGFRHGARKPLDINLLLVTKLSWAVATWNLIVVKNRPLKFALRVSPLGTAPPTKTALLALLLALLGMGCGTESEPDPALRAALGAARRDQRLPQPSHGLVARELGLPLLLPLLGRARGARDDPRPPLLGPRPSPRSLRRWSRRDRCD